jgi:hypothetical protein
MRAIPLEAWGLELRQFTSNGFFRWKASQGHGVVREKGNSWKSYTDVNGVERRIVSMLIIYLTGIIISTLWMRELRYRV